ncbi:MAG: DUF4386 family protein [Actinomycetota bacterium]
MTAPSHGPTLRPRDAEPAVSAPGGRPFGAIVLAAFVLYGVGSALADRPIGLVLVALNSIAVAYAGLLGFRLVRRAEPGVGAGYLAARVAEAALLAGGVLLAQAADLVDADVTGYLLAMLALATGSIPFCRSLGRGRWLPGFMARWGTFGYAALGVGALVELATGRAVTVVFAVPGGLFELALGLYLLRFGFRRPVA